ncbi:AzlC family ABC transporter permease [Actinomadura barringtoniae]|uniref:AzlC family ABC transporter permease n=1 Tax=Actinomadura barringtoniae TaxID=1427535 RepID=A0A939PV79_9ACTN|nr:AzlC family ABC transporter permease [Actinomadura barringtoniae]MBO2455416.1 AzlC family ABC transporter permease [Actinomadura barringtoniae]
MRSFWRTLGRATVRDIALVCAAVSLVGVSYGATAVTDGLPLWLPVVLGLLVVAASSEFMFIGIVAAGGNPFAAVLAGLLLNARHLPFGLGLPDVLGRGPRRLLGVHLMNDETVVFARAQPDRARASAAYWACGLGILLSWPLGTVVGGLAGTFIDDSAPLGLDAVFPAVLLALVLPALREHRVSAVAGAVVAVATTPFLPIGLPVLLALSVLAVAR